MGISRMLYGKMSEKLNLTKTMLLSGLLCVACYLLASLSPVPILGLAGCAICGFSVGIMWPGHDQSFFPKNVRRAVPLCLHF